MGLKGKARENLGKTPWIKGEGEKKKKKNKGARSHDTNTAETRNHGGKKRRSREAVFGRDVGRGKTNRTIESNVKGIELLFPTAKLTTYGKIPGGVPPTEHKRHTIHKPKTADSAGRTHNNRVIT